MREDAIKLFGFTTSEEREWFRLLQTVQGVGAKVALSILSTQTIPDLARAVAFEDKAHVGRAPGVGPKLAARIVAELKDKAAAISAPLHIARGEGAVVGFARPQGAAAEAVSALVNLATAKPKRAKRWPWLWPAKARNSRFHHDPRRCLQRRDERLGPGALACYARAVR